MEILQPFFPPGAASRHRFHPEHSGYAALSASVHQIFRCIRETLLSPDLLLKSELLRFFYLLAASPELAPIVPPCLRLPKNSGGLCSPISRLISLSDPIDRGTCQAVAFEQKVIL